jgi:hypothetical protein
MERITGTLQMSPAQTQFYWSLWKGVCIRQGWTTKNGMTTAEIDAKRKEVMREVFRRDFSSKDIQTNDQFTLIKNRFLFLKDNLQGAIEDGSQVENKKRQLLWVIKNRLRPCLAVYIERPDDYIAKLLRDGHHIYKGVSTIDDLSAVETTRQSKKTGREITDSPLKRFVYTLSRCIDDLRHNARDTVHYMHQMAGIPCKAGCAECAHGVISDNDVPEHAVVTESGENPF